MTDVAVNADTSNAPVLVATTARKTWAIVRFIQQILPFAVFALALLAWQLTVRINNIPHYILPAPTLVLKTLWDNLSSLMVSWLYTMKITFGTLLVSGVAHKLFCAACGY